MDIPPDIDRQVSAWLDSARLRRTAIRVNVAAALLQSDGPTNADQIFQTLKARDGEGCLASVYRVLGELEAHGIVQRDRNSGAQGNKSIYRRQGDLAMKCDYLVRCGRCGRRHRIADPSLTGQLSLLLHSSGFKVPSELLLEAHCRDCGAGAGA